MKLNGDTFYLVSKICQISDSHVYGKNLRTDQRYDVKLNKARFWTSILNKYCQYSPWLKLTKSIQEDISQEYLTHFGYLPKSDFYKHTIYPFLKSIERECLGAVFKGSNLKSRAPCLCLNELFYFNKKNPIRSLRHWIDNVSIHSKTGLFQNEIDTMKIIDIPEVLAVMRISSKILYQYFDRKSLSRDTIWFLSIIEKFKNLYRAIKASHWKLSTKRYKYIQDEFDPRFFNHIKIDIVWTYLQIETIKFFETSETMDYRQYFENLFCECFKWIYFLRQEYKMSKNSTLIHYYGIEDLIEKHHGLQSHIKFRKFCEDINKQKTLLDMLLPDVDNYIKEFMK